MTEGWRELLVPLLDAGQRTYWPLLAATVAVGVLAVAITERTSLTRAWRRVRRGLLAPALWTHRSSVLDVQLAISKGLLRAMGWVPWVVGAAGVAGATSRALGESPALWHAVDPAAVTVLYSAALFVAWDASRYLVHRLLHEVPALWELHQVHHSAEVLTPLTYHRTHPLESALYAMRGGLVTGLVAGVFLWAFGPSAVPAQLAGVGAIGFALNLLGGNLRHSHVWISYGAAERWLISPAQHQLHHELDGHGNYGAWLAIWDRMGGSLQTSGARRELTFGLAADQRNHAPDDLLGVLVGPIRGALRSMTLRPLWAAAALLLVPLAVRADEPAGEDTEDPSDTDDTDDEDPPSADEVISIVDTRGRTPRVAGSAHVIDAETLERFENDDIHRVLAPVPGVYVRDEDGLGLRPNIGLRGANSDRSAKVTLEEDGVLLAPAPYSAPAAYYFPMVTRLVGVEVFKGPAATSHGPNTVGGAINLQTRAVPLGSGGGLDVAYGSNNTLKLHGHLGYGGRQFGALVEGVLLRSDGFKTLPGGGPTGFLKGEMMVKVRANTDPGRSVVSGIELKLGYSGERSHETYLGLSDADFAEDPYQRYAASALGLMSWKRAQSELAWTLRAGKNLDLRVVGYYHHLDRAWRKLNSFGEGGPDLHDLLLSEGGGQSGVFLAILRGEEDSSLPRHQLNIGTNSRRFHAGGVQGRARWRSALGKARNELEIGVRVHRDQIARTHDSVLFDMRSGELVAADDTPTIDTENTHSATAFATYVTNELSIGPLRLLPGVRLEVIHTDARDHLSGSEQSKNEVVGLPGFGVHLQATPWLSILSGVHRGFSPTSPSSVQGTKPETSWNVELGARFEHRGATAELIGFFNHYDNLTPRCTGSSGCANDQLGEQFSAGKVAVYGLEALLAHELELPAGLALRGRLSYTFTGSRFLTAFVSGFDQFGAVAPGFALPYVPEHQGSASIGLLHDRASIEVTGKALSAMRDVAGSGTIRPEALIPASVVLDLAVNVRVSEFLGIYCTINNLTNTRVMVSRRPFGARPGRPFSAMVGAKLRF